MPRLRIILVLTVLGLGSGVSPAEEDPLTAQGCRERLERLLRSPHPPCDETSTALADVAAFGGREDVAAVTRALRHADPLVVTFAAEALGRMEGESVAPASQALLQELRRRGTKVPFVTEGLMLALASISYEVGYPEFRKLFLKCEEPGLVRALCGLFGAERDWRMVMPLFESLWTTNSSSLRPVGPGASLPGGLEGLPAEGARTVRERYGDRRAGRTTAKEASDAVFEAIYAILGQRFEDFDSLAAWLTANRKLVEAKASERDRAGRAAAAKPAGESRGPGVRWKGMWTRWQLADGTVDCYRIETPTGMLTLQAPTLDQEASKAIAEVWAHRLFSPVTGLMDHGLRAWAALHGAGLPSAGPPGSEVPGAEFLRPGVLSSLRRQVAREAGGEKARFAVQATEIRRLDVNLFTDWSVYCRRMGIQDKYVSLWQYGYYNPVTSELCAFLHGVDLFDRIYMAELLSEYLFFEYCDHGLERAGWNRGDRENWASEALAWHGAYSPDLVAIPVVYTARAAREGRIQPWVLESIISRDPRGGGEPVRGYCIIISALIEFLRAEHPVRLARFLAARCGKLPPASSRMGTSDVALALGLRESGWGDFVAEFLRWTEGEVAGHPQYSKVYEAWLAAQRGK